MSQFSQQDDEPYDSLPQSAQDSPTVGRHQAQYLSSSPNPALDLGKRSQRKAAPSPLQTSTVAASSTSASSPSSSTSGTPLSGTPTKSAFARTGARQSPGGIHIPDGPRSPKERLDDLLASERKLYPIDDSPTDTSQKDSFRFPRPAPEPNGGLRSVSDSVLNPKLSEGLPTSTRPPMPSNAPRHRLDMDRAAPRTSSIDSAISSVSSAHHSKNDSADPPDVASVIQAAGSPEAAIQHLLKEKQSQAAQNAQLWRLVDKQRAMILGLNKDLERALKDKERYRKKAKETIAQLANPSPVESNSGAVVSEAGSTVSEHGNTASTKPSVETLVSGLRDLGTDQPHSPTDATSRPAKSTSSPVQAPGPLALVGAAQKIPSPTKQIFQPYNPNQRKANDAAQDMPYGASAPPSRSLPSEPPRGPPPKAPLPKAPSSTTTSPPASPTAADSSPSSYQNLKQFPNPPPRKAPPAPLKLSKDNEPSSHLHQASGAGDDSDSDYDDILEVDEMPAIRDRGRRRTREEDDKERESAAIKEAEMRSLSKKSKKSKSRTPKTPKDGNFDPKDTMIQNSRQTVPIAPPVTLVSSPDSNAGSLDGMLAATRPSDILSTSLAVPLLSPGLPASPRPVDRGVSPLSRASNPSSMISPPVSPRGIITAFPGPAPLSPRAPRQAIPLPPNTPMSIASPGMHAGQPLNLVSPTPLVINKKTLDPDYDPPPYEFPSPSTGICKDFVTEEYPDLLLPPNALPSVDVKVASSRLKPSRASILFPKNFEEDPVFTLAVFSRSTGKELWRVEKDSISLTHLDQALRQSSTIAVRPPEKSLMSGHAPAKLDARRVALETYLDEILNTQMDTSAALEICRYLSTNAMEPNAEDLSPTGDSTTESPTRAGPGGRALRNGYLTKRGKNFGGWKARFFVLDGPILKYYESPGGPHLGAIKLQNAQIGKQAQTVEPVADLDDMDNQYRHAFLILEPKRKDSSSHVRHVLCAESDKERDQWVDALLQYVDYKDSEEDEHAPSSQKDVGRNSPAGSTNANGMHGKKKTQAAHKSHIQHDSNDDLRGISYEDTKQGSIPSGVKSKHSHTPSPPANGFERETMSQHSHSHASKAISAPKNAQVIQDAGAWGNKHNIAPQAMEDKKQKKRSFFGFGSSKPRPSGESLEALPNDSSTNLTQMSVEQHGPVRPVFGAPLAEAVRYNHPADVPNIELPAVVYRCIEYLDAQNAAMEEGIFRLSGSNVVIKQLRERFNTEGDVNLVTDEQYYDIHAVASLLKLYLRELPTTILTRELHLEFLAVTELRDINDKISALNVLVHRLPSANNSLLRNLAGFLINVVNHSDQNKMTIRNVGIVFSPTLNIPAPVFALFLQQYEDIFDQEPDHPRDQSSPVEHTVNAPPLTPEDIRSPRQQIFQNLPTPSYDQQSFNQVQSFPQPQHHLSQMRGNDTGFTPLQPSYETQYQPFPMMGGPEYGHRGPSMVGPAYEQYSGGGEPYRKFASDNSTGLKNKRRESSMFGLGMPPRKGSNNKLRDDQPITEQSFFD